MGKRKALVFLLLLAFVACLPALPVHADGGVGGYPPPTFDLQGAKIVSEGAYFWFKLTNTVQSNSSGVLSTTFYMQFNMEFTLVALRIDGLDLDLKAHLNGGPEGGGSTGSGVGIEDSSTNLLWFDLNYTNSAEILFTAPWLKDTDNPDANYTLFSFDFSRVGRDSGEGLVFLVQVVSLHWYYATFSEDIFNLQHGLDFANHEIYLLQNITGFDWQAYCNDPNYNWTSIEASKLAKPSTFNPVSEWAFITETIGCMMFLLGFLAMWAIHEHEMVKAKKGEYDHAS